MAATGTSLMIAFAAVLIIVFIGIAIGSIAGYAGGWVDNVMMRFVDVAISLPALFIIIAFVAFWGASIWTIILALGITGWTTAARLVRGEFLSLREVDYVQAARALGANPRRIIVRHMLPPALAPIIVAASLGVADSVVTEAALSFIGLGLPATVASLGTLLNVAFEYLNREPYLVLFPSTVLILIVLAANFIGDGIRDALDPRQRVEGQ
jgi:peptide/nickel transport system permease protein